MKLMLLGIAIILFGTGFIITFETPISMFGIAVSIAGLIIVFVGFFGKESK